MKERELQKYNRQAANVGHLRGPLSGLDEFIYPGGRPQSFIMSGNGGPERYEPLEPLLEAVIGSMPVLVLHDHNTYLEALVRSVWERQFAAAGRRTPFCAVNEQQLWLEPFQGMADDDVIKTFQSLVKQTAYTMTPAFERVAYAHLAILREMQVPTSLSGFYYLAGIRDIGRLHELVMGLPCGRDRAMVIWSDLGVDEGGARDQFDLFRLLVNSLAAEAVQNGWSADKRLGGANGYIAMQRAGTITLSLNNCNTELLLSYLVSELRLSGSRDFFLLLDGISVSEELAKLLRDSQGAFGLVGDNVPGLMPDEDTFNAVAERTRCIIMFKHATSRTAEIFSELCGKYDAVRISETVGNTRGFFKVLPQGRQRGQQRTTEERYRVMPGEILGLGPQQAIVFDAANDQILFIN